MKISFIVASCLTLLATSWAYEAPAPAPAQQGYYAPQQGYAAPQQGYAAPQQGYAAPQQGYYNAQASHNQGYYGAEASAGYGPPAQAPAAYAPKPDYEAMKKEEWDQYWDNTDLCKAEFGMNKCLMQCGSFAEFFHPRRISQCVMGYVQGLCGSLKGTKKKYDNGYVKMEDGEDCHTSAYTNSIMIMNKLTMHFTRSPFGWFKQQSWPFQAVKLAVEVVKEHSNCVTEAFFHYLHQCSKYNFLDKDDIQCIEDHLDDRDCKLGRTRPDELRFPRLLRILRNQGRVEAMKYIKKYYKETDQIVRVIKELMKDYRDDAQAVQEMDVGFSHTKLEASVDVCPSKYLSMNHGRGDGVEGLPVDCVAFHFPRDPPKMRVPPPAPASKGYGYLADESDYEEPPKAVLRPIKPSPPMPPKGGKELPPLDPFTPKGGIGKTCKDFYQMTKDVYDATKEDIGDMCFTIDGYEIKFLETGEVEELKYEYIDKSKYLPRIPVVKKEEGPSEGSDDSEDLLADEQQTQTTSARQVNYVEIVSRARPLPSGYATCYTASWRAQKTCTSHLSEWRMKVSCCKSYKSIMDKHNAKKPYPAQGGYVHPANGHVQPQYNQPQYGYQPGYAAPAPAQGGYAAPSSGYSLLDEEKMKEETSQDKEYTEPAPAPAGYSAPAPAPAPAGYTAPAPAPAGYVVPQQGAYYAAPAKAYEPIYTDLVYQKIVKSSSEKGTIVGDRSYGLRKLDRRAIRRKYNEWYSRVSKAISDTEAAAAESESEYGYASKYAEAYSKKEVAAEEIDFPSVDYKSPYYINGNYNSQQMCQALHIDLDFSEVIPLVTGDCFAQSCLLSQYVTCKETPKEERKKYVKPHYNYPSAQQGYHSEASQGYGYAPAPAAGSYGYSSQALLSSEASSGFVSVASIGLVAGMAALVVLQVVIRRRNAATQPRGSYLEVY